MHGRRSVRNARTKLDSDPTDNDIAVTVFAVAVEPHGVAGGPSVRSDGGPGISARRQPSAVGWIVQR
jgi:hypothetical protein